MKKIMMIAASSLLCACSGFFDKDNTPSPAELVKFTPTAKIHTLWNVSTGWGAGNGYFTYVPAVTASTVYTASKNGYVIATDKLTGKIRWRIDIHAEISAGPAATDELVIIGSRGGDIIALHTSNGKIAWKARTSSEILAPPAIGHGVIVVKAVDGNLTAFSADNGRALWHYQQTEPTLILRGASAPQINGNTVIAGFANGNLAKLTLQNGNLLWQQPIATAEGSFAIQRMIDIDANPIIEGNRIYTVTYQGRIVAIDFSSGQMIWTHPLSSYTGMTIDDRYVYVTDAKSDVWAFDKNSGKVNWHQTQLEARHLSGPALIGNTIVVGDAEGYLHWLNRNDGHFIARNRVALSGIFATPVTDNTVIYVVTKDGQLAAYSL
jgi:outer membrane protein assembly factor BamB